MLGFGLRFIWSYWLCKVYMHMVYSAADNVFMAHRQWQGWLDLSNITRRLQQNTTISQHIGSWNFILPLLWSCCVAWTCRYFKFRKQTYLYITFQRFMNTSRTQDTLDPRLFSTMSSVPKCLTFYCRCRSVCGTLRHQCWTVSTSYEGAEVSNRHFGTSAELSRTDRRRVFVLVSLHHLMSHLHHPSWSSDCFSRHFCIYKIVPDIQIWVITHFNQISLVPVHLAIHYLYFRAHVRYVGALSDDPAWCMSVCHVHVA